MFNFKASPIVCYCIEVDEVTILNAAKNGADSLKKIKETIKACTGNECAEKNPSGKCCSKDIKNILSLEVGHALR